MRLTYTFGPFLIATVTLIGCGSSTNATPAASDGGIESGVDSGFSNSTVDRGSGPIDTLSLAPHTWTFVPVAGAICRDGSATGIGINIGSKSDKLVIYFEGGGACFNAASCGQNPSKFREKVEFKGRFAAGGGGILDRMDQANPVKDWNFVYVPYCTGDVHAGSAPNTTVTGVTGMQQFVGYSNVELALARLVPTFKNLTQVLDTGISAGGYGAATNYVQLAKAFDPTPVFELDDSGPPMDDPYNVSCLQGFQAQLWGFDKTILKECGADCPDHSNYSIDFGKHVVKAYPHVPFGLVESTEDATISLFFGFGTNNCAQLNGSPTPVPGPTFTMGLADLETKMQGISNFGSFLFRGNQHTSIGSTATLDQGLTPAAATLLAPDGGAGAGTDGGATVLLTDWITQLVAGKVTNVGP